MKFYQVLVASLALVAQMAWAQVNINTANVKELTALKGIGEKKAKAIILYRKANGKFKSASDLSNVKGIGEKTVKNLGADIKTSGSTNVNNLKNTTKTKTKTTKQKSKPNKKDQPNKKKEG